MGLCETTAKDTFLIGMYTLRRRLAENVWMTGKPTSTLRPPFTSTPSLRLPDPSPIFGELVFQYRNYIERQKDEVNHIDLRF